jgi:hypothetical protein
VGWSVRRCAHRIRHSNRDLGSPEAIAWLVRCWHGADCQAIQRKVGGKASISTGPILCSLIGAREHGQRHGVRFVAPMAPCYWMAGESEDNDPYVSVHPPLLVGITLGLFACQLWLRAFRHPESSGAEAVEHVGERSGVAREDD